MLPYQNKKLGIFTKSGWARLCLKYPSFVELSGSSNNLCYTI